MLLVHTALHAEARAVITHFNLRRQHRQHAFTCFAGKDMWLVESGIGKTNAAAAVGWLSGLLSCKHPVWLNIGMAGHANLDIGTCVLAQRIEDQARGRRWYPSMLINNSHASGNLLTVSHPPDNYPDDSMVDMEASGFFAAASRFTSLELIQSLKVIADNKDNPPVRMKLKHIEALFEPRMPFFKQYAGQLLKLRGSMKDPTHPDFLTLLREYHFSTCQQHALQRLLQRFQALHPDTLISQALPTSAKTAGSIIHWLRNETARTQIKF